VVVLILKLALALGILPQATIFVFALAGLLRFGFWGLIAGAIIGYIFTIILGMILPPLAQFFDMGLFKRKYRRAIAKCFYDNNKQEIMSLSRFNFLDEKKIVNALARYINEINDFTVKLEDLPVKRHPHDMDVAGYRENFVLGGKNWAEHFGDRSEIELMRKYVDFCEYSIYIAPLLQKKK
jgi:ABC-type lipoprotein release transport system permease subunit